MTNEFESPPIEISDLNSLFNHVKDTNDLYYLALMILSTKIDEKNRTIKYSNIPQTILPELVFLMNRESIENLLYYYGGETITIPKLSEFRDILYGIQIYNNRAIKGMTWRQSIESMGLPYNDNVSNKLVQLYNDVRFGLEKIKIPESKSGDTM